jgi:hypothetical protein
MQSAGAVFGSGKPNILVIFGDDIGLATSELIRWG